MTLKIWCPTFLKFDFSTLIIGFQKDSIYQTIAYWLKFHIIEKNFEVFKDITMKKALEVVVEPLDIETNYFQFQNNHTYNWNLEGFNISNDSLLTTF